MTLNLTSVVSGVTSQATAVLRDANNNVLTGRVVTWTSSNTTVATVDANGLVTSLTAGTADITASITVARETKSGFATLTVTAPPAPVATVAVTLNPTSVIAGATSQATAVLRDASNNVLTGRAIVWTSSNTAVATVNSSGVVTTLTAGSSNITATSETKSNFAPITVNPPVALVAVGLTPSPVVAGGTSQAFAILKDANGNDLSNRAVTWQSSNTAVATVNPTSGLITTLIAGTTTIIATSEGKTGQATLTVNPPVSTIDVSLSQTPISAGGQSQATAVLRDANNGVLTGRAVVWSVSNSNVAAVNASGLVTALNNGTSLIIATSENVSGQLRLNVTGMQ